MSATVEATRCNACLSDKVYAFMDSEGGVCTVCGEILVGSINGGLSIYEFRRLRGNAPEGLPDEVVNDEDKAQMVRESVRQAKSDVKAVEKEVRELVTDAAGALKTPKAGPGLLQRLRNLIWKPKPEKFPPPKEAEKRGVLPEPVGQRPSAARPHPAKVGPPASVPSVPRMGERWSVGMCLTCGLTAKYTGQVMAGKFLNGKARYVVVQTPGGKSYHGCLLCAKRV